MSTNLYSLNIASSAIPFLGVGSERTRKTDKVQVSSQ